MVEFATDANDRALALPGLTESCTVLEVGFGQGRAAEILFGVGRHALGGALRRVRQ